jgi:putative sugar O-methyltransferase
MPLDQRRLTYCLRAMLSAKPDPGKSRHWAARFTAGFDDRLASGGEMATFRNGRNRLTSGLDDSGTWLRSAAIYEALLREEGTHFIDQFAEAAIGHPRVFRIDGQRLNFNDLILLQYLSTIISYLPGEPACIIEIGGGYGGLMSKLKKKYPAASIVSLDLPEALTLQTRYLSEAFPAADFYLYDDFEAGHPIDPLEHDFTLLPGWLASEIEDQSVDFFVNTRSMMEMTRAVIADYFAAIQRTLRPGGLFFNSNRYCKDTVGEPIRIAEYPYDDRWHVLMSAPSEHQPHIHNLYCARTEIPSAYLAQCLAQLPHDDLAGHTSSRSLFDTLKLLRLWR